MQTFSMTGRLNNKSNKSKIQCQKSKKRTKEQASREKVQHDKQIQEN